MLWKLNIKHNICRLDDFDGEEVDEEALIEQRRQQRMAIVQVCICDWFKSSVLCLI